MEGAARSRIVLEQAIEGGQDPNTWPVPVERFDVVKVSTRVQVRTFPDEHEVEASMLPSELVDPHAIQALVRLFPAKTAIREEEYSKAWKTIHGAAAAALEFCENRYKLEIGFQSAVKLIDKTQAILASKLTKHMEQVAQGVIQPLSEIVGMEIKAIDTDLERLTRVQRALDELAVPDSIVPDNLLEDPEKWLPQEESVDVKRAQIAAMRNEVAAIKQALHQKKRDISELTMMKEAQEAILGGIMAARSGLQKRAEELQAAVGALRDKLDNKNSAEVVGKVKAELALQVALLNTDMLQRQKAMQIAADQIRNALAEKQADLSLKLLDQAVDSSDSQPSSLHLFCGLDASSSMLKAVDGIIPWEELRKSMKQLLDRRRIESPNDTYTIVVFSDTSTLLVEKKTAVEIGDVCKMLGSCQGGGTKFYPVIEAMNKDILSTPDDKIPVAVLFTDGAARDNVENTRVLVEQMTTKRGFKHWAVALGNATVEAQLQYLLEKANGESAAPYLLKCNASMLCIAFQRLTESVDAVAKLQRKVDFIETEKAKKQRQFDEEEAKLHQTHIEKIQRFSDLSNQLASTQLAKEGEIRRFIEAQVRDLQEEQVKIREELESVRPREDYDGKIVEATKEVERLIKDLEAREAVLAANEQQLFEIWTYQSTTVTKGLEQYGMRDPVKIKQCWEAVQELAGLIRHLRLQKVHMLEAITVVVHRSLALQEYFKLTFKQPDDNTWKKFLFYNRIDHTAPTEVILGTLATKYLTRFSRATKSVFAHYLEQRHVYAPSLRNQEEVFDELRDKLRSQLGKGTPAEELRKKRLKKKALETLAEIYKDTCDEGSRIDAWETAQSIAELKVRLSNISSNMRQMTPDEIRQSIIRTEAKIVELEQQQGVDQGNAMQRGKFNKMIADDVIEALKSMREQYTDASRSVVYQLDFDEYLANVQAVAGQVKTCLDPVLKCIAIDAGYFSQQRVSPPKMLPYRQT